MRVLIFCLLSSALFLSSAYAIDVEGEFSLDPQSSYMDYAFVAYSMDVQGEVLSIRCNSSGIYNTLIAQQPDKSFLKSDYSYSADSEIIVDNPKPGKWLLIVTTNGKNIKGPFTMKVDGVKGIDVISADMMDKDLVEEAFAFRGVYSEAKLLEMEKARKQKEKEERIRKIKFLSEQLTLASYRSKLLENLNKEITRQQKSFSDNTRELDSLRKRKIELNEALSEIKKLGSSRNFVKALIDEHLEKVATEMKWRSENQANTSSRLEAYTIAREGIVEVDKISNQLDERKDQFFKLKMENQSELVKIKEEIVHLESQRDSLAKGIATKLLDSSFARYLKLGKLWDDEMNFDNLTGLAAITTKDIKSVHGGEGAIFFTLAAADVGSVSRLEGLYSTYKMTGNILQSSEDSGTDPNVWLPALLPWPPPPPSSQIVLDDYFMNWRSKFNILGDVDQLIRNAAYSNNYPGLRYYGVPGGFASVTQLEQVDSEGVPLDEESRWSTEIVEMKRFSIDSYLKALFTAQPGYYRVVSFVVASKPFAPTSERAKFADLQHWGSSGLNSLPEQIKSQKYSAVHKTTVLVYEFLKEKSSDDPITEIPGRHTAQEHLKSSKLLSYLK